MTQYRRELDVQCCNNWMNGIRTIDNQYPDDNREFTIDAGPGISIIPITAGIKILNTNNPYSLLAGDNIVITPSGDDLIISMDNDVSRTGSTVLTGTINVTGDVTITGNITQNGAAYETHAEQVFTTNDYIVMRDGATGALASGSYSGFQVKKYDGTNDGRLVIDNTGTARVGDVGDEQPLLTRAESGSLTNGQLFMWDAVNQKAIGQGIASTPDPNSAAPISSQGVALALESKDITNDVVISSADITSVKIYQTANVVTISIIGGSTPNAQSGTTVMSGLPTPIGATAEHITQYDGIHVGMIMVDTDGTCKLWCLANSSGAIYQSMTYIASSS